MKYVLIILPLFSFAQTTTTLTGAIAQTNTWLYTGASGVMNNGHVYLLQFKQNYSGATPLPLEIVRIDCSTSAVQYIILANSLSSSSSLWRGAMDNAGALWIGLNTNNRHIYRILPKGDSLTYVYYGNAIDSAALAYSIVLGLDGNMYFGGSSSNTSTTASYWDSTINTFHSFAEANPNQDYTVFISGNAQWIYRQIGQRSNTFELYATRKSDGYTKFIASNTGLMNCGTRASGVVFQINSIWYRIADTVLIPDPNYNLSPEVYHFETNGDGAHFNASYPTVTSSFNRTSSRVSWNVNGDTASALVTSSFIANTVRKVYPDLYDSNKIYYIGETYGDVYSYNIATATTTDIGFPGFNVYSELQVNDSTIYLAGYSSGVLARWNTHQPWTAETFYNGSTHHLGDSTNPKLIDYYRTYDGSHHPYYMIKIDSLLITAGPVERVATTCSIGTYNMARDSMYGYDYNKIPDLIIQDAKRWRKNVVMSTTGTGAKLYIYDPSTNLMDSIQTGYSDNGKIYIVGDKLIGVAGNKIYNYNLSSRTLVNSYSYPTNSITYSSQMPDGRILITSTGITLPKDMTFEFVPFTGYTSEINYTSSKGYVIPNSGANVVQLNSYFRTDAGVQDAERAFNMNCIKFALPTSRVNANVVSINGQ